MTNKEKNGQQQKDYRGGSTFCVDKRPTYEKTCYTSAAKWEVRALGGSTIIYCKETITFKERTLKEHRENKRKRTQREHKERTQKKNKGRTQK